MRLRGFRPRQCERARELASLRLDGELSELEEALLRAHLHRCGDCRAFAVDLGGFTGELRAASLEHPGHPIRLPRRATALQRVQFVAAAAAVAVVAGVGSMLAMLGSPAAGSPPQPPSAGQTVDGGNLAQVRSLRRKELVFTSSIIRESANDERILRLS